MQRKSFSISFRKKFEHVYAFLLEKKNNGENVSDYICHLIEHDMNKMSGKNDDLEEKVREILQKITKSSHSLEPNYAKEVDDDLSADQKHDPSHLIDKLFD
ncbi:hypothetical protein B0I26_1013 [Anoxybacillus vitaminiphilus]|uniref:Uncharacterized protein n=1 Tax=Paranoxybacillus vitaminiphilus TaxID=581036 RepID=A0A327YR88_9BACL|nr:hypothetical protein [Anoxybacillus vitaminiphilus]RAK23052.1 hypothetical protein B0I26_1013 [Anoxybacillus vitaminiphilus]